MGNSRKDYINDKHFFIGSGFAGSMFVLASICYDGCVGWYEGTPAFFGLGSFALFISFCLYWFKIKDSPWKKIIEEENKQLEARMSKHERGPNGYLMILFGILLMVLLYYLGEFLSN